MNHGLRNRHECNRLGRNFGRPVMAAILFLLLGTSAWGACETTFQNSGQDLEVSQMDFLTESLEDEGMIEKQGILHLIVAIWNCGPDQRLETVQIKYLLFANTGPDAEPLELFEAISDPIGKGEGQILYTRVDIPSSIPAGKYFLSAVIHHDATQMVADLNPNNDTMGVILDIGKEHKGSAPESLEEDRLGTELAQGMEGHRWSLSGARKRPI